MDDVHLQGETGMGGVDEREQEGGRQSMVHGWNRGESKFHSLPGCSV
jgi:hypothetical protein